MNNARRRIGVLVGVLIAMCMCAMSGAACLTQSGDPASDEERQVREWVERDIARAKAFVAAPPPLHVKIEFERGQPASVEQAQDRLTKLAALRRAIEGKPDHPLRWDYRTLLHDAPGGSLQTMYNAWLGSRNGQVIWRQSYDSNSDMLNDMERSFDLGMNGKVQWRTLGRAPHELSLTPTDRQRLNGNEPALTVALETVVGWYGFGCAPYQGTSLAVEKAANDWRVRVEYDKGTVKYGILWDRQNVRGFISSRSSRDNTGVERHRVARVASKYIIADYVPCKTFRVEEFTQTGVAQEYTSTVSIEVTTVQEGELLAAVDLPTVDAGTVDAVRGLWRISTLTDERFPDQGPPYPQRAYSEAVRSEFASDRTRSAAGVQDVETGIRLRMLWIVVAGIILAAALIVVIRVRESGRAANGGIT